MIFPNNAAALGGTEVYPTPAESRTSLGRPHRRPGGMDSGLITETGLVPAVDQIEVHPHFANTETATACARQRVAVEAWSPLGQGTELQDPVIAGIAEACDRSSAQVILRWHLQHGRIVVPKTTHRHRMEENLALLDFELSADQLASIDGLDQGESGRVGPHPETMSWMP